MADPIRAALERLVGDIQEARDCIEDWGAYASEYFQQKHDLAGDLAAFDRKIAAARAALDNSAAPAPLASDVYFEFAVSDADYCTQAGGIAPTYAQALSEGQNYLAQYQQDGPHTLELRRVEVLSTTPPAPAVGEAPTPSEQLVEQWVAEGWHEGTPVRVAASDLHLAAKAAEWGARWGRPAPPADGEVGVLVAWLRKLGPCSDDEKASFCRAADLLEQQHARIVELEAQP